MPPAPDAEHPAGPPPPDHLGARVGRLQRRLRRAQVTGLLVTEPADIRYLTGFVGDDSWAIVPSRGRRVTLISDSRFEQQIAREAPHARVVIRKGAMAEEAARWLKSRRGAGPRALGVQPRHVSMELHDKLTAALGESAVVGVEDQLLDQRAVKDAEEADAIRAALSIQQRAFTELLGQLEPGMTERQVAADLEYHMRRLGSDGPSFPTIAAAGANAALPHAIPGQSKLRKGGILLLDWGAKSGGYCSDLTRVVALGKMPPKMREVYQVVLDAQLTAIEAIAPGKPLREVDAAARRVIAKAGYGKRFGHGLGHGIGLAIHEQPALSPRAPAEAALEPGHVVTVEPGVYLPGAGGVRIEDDVLVTPQGREVLSNLPKSLESAII